MAKRDLYVRLPRWLEVSGLPEKLCREHGSAAWLVFRKLCEIDCEANLVPDWFSVTLPDLVTWTGLDRKSISAVLACIQAEHLAETQKIGDGWRVRIQVPLPVPREESAIRAKLRAMGLNAPGIRLRYLRDEGSEDRFVKVLELYQGVFGTRMTSQLADELREIAETFEWPVIEEAFADAREHKRTNFYSVWHRLYKEVHDERVAEDIGDASRPSLPSGYELT